MGNRYSVEGRTNMIILSCLLLCLTTYLIFIFKEIKHINEQLSYILDRDTNAEITTTSKHKFIKDYVNKTNQVIRQNKQMKQDQQKNELELHQILTSLAHDLKTPLTVASGYTQILLQNHSNNELAKKINISLHTVSYYLNCLMDYNLIQEKSITINMEKIDFSQFLMEQLFQYYEEFEQNKIQIDINIPTKIIVNNDKLILKRIIENILSNMLKYSNKHASIIVKTFENRIELICQNDYVGEIADPARLLLRFQTLDDSRQNKSMGIGLHIIQELTKLIQGTFSIDVTACKFETKITLNNLVSENSF